MQVRYGAHRTTRNQQQKAKLLSTDFAGLIIDPILYKIIDEPGFEDPRHCKLIIRSFPSRPRALPILRYLLCAADFIFLEGLVFWARPPVHIRSLARQVQEKLLVKAPSEFVFTIYYRQFQENFREKH